jgi:SAM-dependent methyltransferase
MEYAGKSLIDSYSSKVEEHWFTMFSPIIKYLGNLKGKKVLDIGCGSGELAYVLANKASTVIGADHSDDWIKRCNSKYKKNNLQFIKSDATNLSELEDCSFDIIIMNMVILDIDELSKVQKVFGEINRLLKKGGDFIFSDLHPICMMTKKAGNRKQTYSKDFSYFKDGSKFTAGVNLPDGRKIEFKDAHWTLELYTIELEKNSMYLKRIIESNYPKDAPKKFIRYPFPEYIIFCCKKF